MQVASAHGPDSPSARSCNLEEREMVMHTASGPATSPPEPRSVGNTPTWLRPLREGGQGRPRGVGRAGRPPLEKHVLADHFVEPLPVGRRGALLTGHLEQSVGNGLIVELSHTGMPWRQRVSHRPGSARTWTQQRGTGPWGHAGPRGHALASSHCPLGCLRPALLSWLRRNM